MKMNKKGFTLAELLIVIAIIAILIGIAIPAFSASLRNAKLAVDHSNIRAMYAVLNTAKMTGSIDDTEQTTGIATPTSTSYYILTKDGTIKSVASATAALTDTDAYLTQVEATASADCLSSALCQSVSKHPKDSALLITYTAPTAGGTGGSWAFSFVEPTP